jgi:hypothetical protein
MYAKCITVDWEYVARGIGLGIGETANLFADGRVSGEILQRVAIRQFGLLTSKNCELYDATFPLSQEKIEIRLITRNGVQTRPSNQIGAGRSFDKNLYMKKLVKVEYFLFIDLREIANTIPCYLVPSGIIGKFFIKEKLDKGGATRSKTVIADLLFESVRLGWDQGLP